MAPPSSYLARGLFRRDQQPALPLHHKSSEYSLRDLSPHPAGELRQDDHLALKQSRRSPHPRMSSGSQGSLSKSKKKQTRFLFAGPPSPIASSRCLEPDPEYGVASSSRCSSGGTSASKPALASKLLDSVTKGQTLQPRPCGPQSADAVWCTLHRREKGIHQNLQRFLDAQDFGLGNGTAQPHDAMSTMSCGSTSTPTEACRTPATADPHSMRGRSAQAMSESILGETTTRVTSQGTVVPVRQPRVKPPSLRAARTGITRSITSLAALKAEEDEILSSAIAARKQALAAASQLKTRRHDISSQLSMFEEDAGEPLALQITGLSEESDKVTKEIEELELRLQDLRGRKRSLDIKLEEIQNRREAGLSGYRGALKQVESEVARLMRRPPVRPLDLVALGDLVLDDQVPTGDDFFKLRPDRRTLVMAEEWWESEINLLDKRKINIDLERTALEEGAELWKKALVLVSDFESSLRAGVNSTGRDSTTPLPAEPAGKGKQKKKTVAEEAMLKVHLHKMGPVIAGLQDMVVLAEEKNWTLLICAIGAELDAFRQGHDMLKNLLISNGYTFEDDDEEKEHDKPSLVTPAVDGPRRLIDVSDDTNGNDGTTTGPSPQTTFHTTREEPESDDNEVPADLLVGSSQALGSRPPHVGRGHHHSLNEDKNQSRIFDHDDNHPDIVSRTGALSTHEDSSENEIPSEFLAEHHPSNSQDDID